MLCRSGAGHAQLRHKSTPCIQLRRPKVWPLQFFPCVSLPLQILWEIRGLKEITDTSTSDSCEDRLGKHSHSSGEQGKGVLFGLFSRQFSQSRGVWPGADKVRSCIGDLKPGPEAPVQRRLTPTPCLQDPSDGINNSFLAMLLLLLPQFRFKFQTLPFVTIITNIPGRAHPPKWCGFSLTLLLLV